MLLGFGHYQAGTELLIQIKNQALSLIGMLLVSEVVPNWDNATDKNIK